VLYAIGNALGPSRSGDEAGSGRLFPTTVPPLSTRRVGA
jgi:hypothetical protein